MDRPPYHLGLPLWGDRAWTGSLYTRDAKPGQFLEQYARVFSCVEGNTTFYSLPSDASVERWREHTPESFRFAFKFPKGVTHELGLRECERQAAQFLSLMSPLGPRLGPFMIQLPAGFGSEQLGDLERFLRWLPSDFRYAVELRHPALYSEEASRRVDELLGEHRADRIAMDTRPLRSGDAGHPDVAAAQHRKPDLPFVATRTGAHGMVRLICHPAMETNEPWLPVLADQVLDWIGQDVTPFMFIHCANNAKAPPIARRFHEVLRERGREHSTAQIAEHPVWPGDDHQTAAGQLSML